MAEEYYYCRVVYVNGETENTQSVFGAIKRKDLDTFRTSLNSFIDVHLKMEKKGYSNGKDVIIARTENMETINKSNIQFIQFFRAYKGISVFENLSTFQSINSKEPISHTN